MAASVRAVATSAGNGTTITLSAPAGVQATDRLYAFVEHQANIHFPGGFGLWQGIGQAFAGSTFRAFELSGSPLGGPWAFEADAATAFAVVVVAVTGAVGENVALDVVSVGFTAAGSAPVAPSVTPGASDDLLLHVVGWGSATTFTPPGGVTELADVRSGTTATDQTLWVGSRTLTGGQGSGTTTATVTNDNPFGYPAAQHVTATFAIKSTQPPTSWVGDFETGDTSQYDLYQAAAADRVQILTDSPYQGTRYTRFTSLDDDVYPLTPTANPRAQLVKRGLLFPGSTRWITWATRFPADFPATLPVTPELNSFFVFAQIHGSPFNGSPQIGFDVDYPERITLRRNGQYAFDTVWSTPLVRGTWHAFALRIRFAQDESGWIELHYNGKQQTFRNGSRRLYMQTVQSDQNTGVEWIPTLYRAKGMYPTASLDHDAHRIDTATPSTLIGQLEVAPPVVVRSGTALSARVV